MENEDHDTSEQAAAFPPPILSYATKGSRRRSSSFVLGSLLLAVAFVTAFWVVETVTSNVMLFHMHIRGSANPGTIEEFRLEKRQFNDLATEFAWSIPATLVMLGGLTTFGPRAGLRLSPRVFAAVVAGAIAYSWVRWGLYFTPYKQSEGADFLIAMLLAALTGVGASFVRSKLRPASA